MYDGSGGLTNTMSGWSTMQRDDEPRGLVSGLAVRDVTAAGEPLPAVDRSPMIHCAKLQRHVATVIYLDTWHWSNTVHPKKKKSTSFSFITSVTKMQTDSNNLFTVICYNQTHIRGSAATVKLLYFISTSTSGRKAPASHAGKRRHIKTDGV